MDEWNTADGTRIVARCPYCLFSSGRKKVCVCVCVCVRKWLKLAHDSGVGFRLLFFVATDFPTQWFEKIALEGFEVGSE
jgi:hypothetical protein